MREATSKATKIHKTNECTRHMTWAGSLLVVIGAVRDLLVTGVAVGRVFLCNYSCWKAHLWHICSEKLEEHSGRSGHSEVTKLDDLDSS